MTVRPAAAPDVPAIAALIKVHADRGKMIARGPDELFAALPAWLVAEQKGELVGCASVHVFWADLAEIKGLAVKGAAQGKGVGKALVLACHAKLRALGVGRAFALTSEPAFFEKLGYRRVKKEELPHFIWGECVRCPSFPVCNEEALLYDLGGKKRKGSR